MELSTPIEELTRVGKTTASRLHRLGIRTARDLLFHFPARYEDWTNNIPIDQVLPNQNISVQGKITSIKNFQSPRKRMAITEAVLSNDSGSIKVIWFNQPFLLKNFPIGTSVSLSGKTDLSRNEIILKSPKYEIIKPGDETTFTNRILPVYPLSLNLTQKQLQFLVNHALPLAADLEDTLPEFIREKESLPHLSTAIRWIHEPETIEQAELAQKRFAFEELFYLQLQSAYLRELNNQYHSESFKFHEEKIQELVKSLPFTLTDDQKKTAWKIFLDLGKDQPMNRLVQGDVGSGKTIVAAMAMYNIALNGAQSVLMAPTEVLAGQHFNTISELFKDLDISVAILTRTKQAISAKRETQYLSKKNLLENLQNGAAQIVIGTHALVQPDIAFQNLGLAIIDEQHRFGVEQRKRLRNQSGDNNTTPHLLSMTATPIPRTLTLVFYGDLAVSSIRQKPKDRLDILTNLVPAGSKNEAYQFIEKQMEKGHQAYVVCPLIEESDKLGVASVTEEYEKLKKIFPNRKIGILHGKMKSTEKEEVMDKFKEGKIEMLVATTVIEVGVDIPNATVMMIEGAERFGLSQLHQIRGRVGRSEKQSYCFLFATDETSSVQGRLQRFIQCKDGFQVSELDLQIRGGGELLGTRQSGAIELQFIDLSDTKFIEYVNEISNDFLETESLEDYPLLKAHIEELIGAVHLE